MFKNTQPFALYYVQVAEYIANLNEVYGHEYITLMPQIYNEAPNIYRETAQMKKDPFFTC